MHRLPNFARFEGCQYSAMNIILGETCLLGYQLRRLGVVDGPTQLFENMLVTAEGVHSFIKNNCADIIDEEYTQHLYYSY